MDRDGVRDRQLNGNRDSIGIGVGIGLGLWGMNKDSDRDGVWIGIVARIGNE